MEFLRFRTVAMALSLLLAGATARAQDAWAYAMFEKTDYNFGVVARGAEARFQLKLVNNGPETVHIVGTGTRCACASARAVQETLAPGQAGAIEISFDTKKYVHLRETSLLVSFDRPARADVQIPVKIYIRTDVVVTPGEAAFGVVSMGSTAERRLNIAYVGRPNWVIKDVLHKSKHLEARVQEVSRSGGSINYELAVTLKPSAPAGEIREQLTLVTDDAEAPQFPIQVEGRVEAEYSVSPELVDFGRLRAGERKVSYVVVRGKQPFLVETIESGKSAGVFEVQLPRAPQKQHVLPLTLIAPAETGSLDEDFSISIKGVAEPLTFRAHCQVVPAAQ
ncbi:MAG: DUF1573 domain-containing protein [Planctomycetaceae bacterium]